MGKLDRAQVPIACPNCGYSSKRRPEQLRRELLSYCTSCGGDVTAEAHKMLQAIEAAERVLADDPVVIRSGKWSEINRPH
jgi:predicted RNA-binding Zn-ribbon protein involved in translation (DUF1610 family)